MCVCKCILYRYPNCWTDLDENWQGGGRGCREQEGLGGSTRYPNPPGKGFVKGVWSLKTL